MFRIAFALQAAICQAIGVDPKQTSRIVIDLPADSVPRVRITQYLTSKQEDALVRVFEAATFDEAPTPTSKS